MSRLGDLLGGCKQGLYKPGSGILRSPQRGWDDVFLDLNLTLHFQVGKVPTQPQKMGRWRQRRTITRPRTVTVAIPGHSLDLSDVLKDIKGEAALSLLVSPPS